MTWGICFLCWGLSYLLHLSIQPAYRRYAPCRFTPLPQPLQRALRLLLPLAALLLEGLTRGLYGVFIWGFSAPLIGFAVALSGSLLQRIHAATHVPPL